MYPFVACESSARVKKIARRVKRRAGKEAAPRIVDGCGLEIHTQRELNLPVGAKADGPADGRIQHAERACRSGGERLARLDQVRADAVFLTIKAAR
jgi:hypothetical protein